MQVFFLKLQMRPIIWRGRLISKLFHPSLESKGGIWPNWLCSSTQREMYGDYGELDEIAWPQLPPWGY